MGRGGGGGEGFVFQMREASFLSGGCTPLGGASVLMGEVFIKDRRMGGGRSNSPIGNLNLESTPPLHDVCQFPVKMDNC